MWWPRGFPNFNAILDSFVKFKSLTQTSDILQTNTSTTALLIHPPLCPTDGPLNTFPPKELLKQVRPSVRGYCGYV
eukprot:scaffold24723_cov131-Isochrysis_galbana.AAC.5